MDLLRPVLRDWDAQVKILDGLLAEPSSERIDEMILSEASSGVRILHRYTAPARDSTGHIFGRMFFFRDITYDKEMERQIIHSQKMDSIGTLAGGVAHDFNNLLTTILGYTELLKRQSQPEDPSHQKLLQIERSANRAAELTGQLLAFSRRNPTNLRLFDLNKLIEETHGMLRSTVPATIEMRFTPAGGTALCGSGRDADPAGHHQPRVGTRAMRSRARRAAAAKSRLRRGPFLLGYVLLRVDDLLDVSSAAGTYG